MTVLLSFRRVLRPVVGAVLALSLLSAGAASPAATVTAIAPPDLREAGDPALQRGLEQVIRDLGLSGEVDRGDLAVSVVDITERDHPRLAMVNGDEMLYAASLPKIAILLGAFVEAQRGTLILNPERMRTLTQMVRVSSNAAAAEALKWVGGESLIAILESPQYKLYDPKGAGGLWVGKSYDSSGAYHRDPLHNLSHGATAFQVARFYQLLDAGALVNPTLTAQMKEVMSNPGIVHKFVKGLQNFAGLTLYRKSGSWGDAHADSALVESNGHKYIMVGLAHNAHGGEWLVQLAPRLHQLVMVDSPSRVAAVTR